MNDLQPLIIIGGATATGKSKIALELAKQINGEIISADSMQVYKYMNIGTAKSSKEEMEAVKHHMVDVATPDEDFSVAKYKEMCKKCIKNITSQGKIPILVGGTGFYINAVIYDNEFSDATVNLDYRNSLYKTEQEKGSEFLHNMLVKIDPESAAQVHHNNVKRVIRAIEFFSITGIKMSDHNASEQSRKPVYNTLFFVANIDREALYSKINERVDQMIETGLIEEVRGLLKSGYHQNLSSMQGIGYKEIIPHINEELPFEIAVSNLKRNTRRYAKRQLTWFRNQTDGIWIDTEEKSVEEIINEQERIFEERI